MKKVTSEQLIVGRTYYANDDQTTPLTFVKYDEDSCPCFTQPNGGFWFEQTDGLCHLAGFPIFYEIPQEPLTLQEKFEQGWEMMYMHSENALVVDFLTFKNGDVAVRYSDGDVTGWSKDDFEEFHTITPPAPKVERVFTPVVWGKNEDWGIGFGQDVASIEEVKSSGLSYITCILEHEKQGDKWVFVKAHEV